MKPYSMTVPNVFPVLAFSFAGLVAIFVGYIATTMPMFISIGIVLGVGAAILTFVRPQLGLGLIVFSMLLSPEFPIAQLAKRAVIVRLDDLLLAGVLVAWFTRSAINKELPSFSKVPLLKPISLYAGICVLSTILGIIRGNLNPFSSFFFVAKYVEYFLLYFMVVYVVSSEKQVKGFLWVGLITAIIVCIHGYYSMSQGTRPYAPFDVERGTAETASLAGYLMIIMAIILAFYVHTKNILVALGLLSIIGFMLPLFFLSESRSSYIAIVPLILSMILLARQRKLILAGTMCVFTITVLVMAPETVEKIEQRLLYTFLNAGQSEEYKVAGFSFGLETSAHTRMESWKAIPHWTAAHPFFGHGVTGVGLVDTNFPLLVGETGLLGLGSFVWIIFSSFNQARCAYYAFDGLIIKSINLALMAIIVGLCAQAIGVNTFIVIRIMEPFWFLAALTMKLNQLYGPEKSIKQYATN